MRGLDILHKNAAPLGRKASNADHVDENER